MSIYSICFKADKDYIMVREEADTRIAAINKAVKRHGVPVDAILVYARAEIPSIYEVKHGPQKPMHRVTSRGRISNTPDKH